jgi:hypothetical protein
MPPVTKTFTVAVPPVRWPRVPRLRRTWEYDGRLLEREGFDPAEVRQVAGGPGQADYWFTDDDLGQLRDRLIL